MGFTGNINMTALLEYFVMCCLRQTGDSSRSGGCCPEGLHALTRPDHVGYRSNRSFS